MIYYMCTFFERRIGNAEKLFFRIEKKFIEII